MMWPRLCGTARNEWIAVEIDPLIARIGRLAHPEQPYSDPRVTLVVQDARAYFNNTDRKYDLIVFAMLDSNGCFPACPRSAWIRLFIRSRVFGRLGLC